MWQRESFHIDQSKINVELILGQLAEDYVIWLSKMCRFDLYVSFEAILANERFLPCPYRGDSPRSELSLTALVGEVFIATLDGYWTRTRSGVWVIGIEHEEFEGIRMIQPAKLVSSRLWSGNSLPVQIHQISQELKSAKFKLKPPAADSPLGSELLSRPTSY